VVISSDVIYPNGEMKDYEAFWLPFKGVQKPGPVPSPATMTGMTHSKGSRHVPDRESARTVMWRAAADLKLTTTNERKIEGLLRQASGCDEAAVPTDSSKHSSSFNGASRCSQWIRARKRLTTPKCWFRNALKALAASLLALLASTVGVANTAAGDEDLLPCTACCASMRSRW
jgi:hypothetical protein